jgi:hypothetical protein
MERKYITSWGFVYKEIAAEKEWRQVDFQQDDKAFNTGNLAIYMEFDFPPDAGKAQYTGNFVVKKITETYRKYPGIAKNYVVLSLEDVELTPEQTKEIQEEVAKIKAKFEQEDGFIPLPLSIQ